MSNELAEKYILLVDATLKRMLIVPTARGLTPVLADFIRVYMEEVAREAARIAYNDCAKVAKLAQDSAYHDRNETSPTSREYAALEGAVGSFAGMALTYEQFERSFCDGEEFSNINVPANMDSLISPSDIPPVKERQLKDPRKKDSKPS